MSRRWDRLTAWFRRAEEECPECRSVLGKADAVCAVCGYDIVRAAKAVEGPRGTV